MIISEGDEVGGAMEAAEILKKSLPDYEMRVSILGHLQRGGSPSAFDRLFANMAGVEAVKSIQAGDIGLMIGYQNNSTVKVSLEKAVKGKYTLDTSKMELVRILSAE